MHRAKWRRMFGMTDPRPAGPTRAGIFVLTMAMATGLLPMASASANSRAEIRLQGTVPAICTISVSNETAELNIVQGAAAVQVATVTEQCNAAAGYTVSVTSGNGGRMVQEAGASVAYSLSYDDATAAAAGSLVTERAATGAVRQRSLSATLPATPQATAGRYADTVTISISAK